MKSILTLNTPSTALFVKKYVLCISMDDVFLLTPRHFCAITILYYFLGYSHDITQHTPNKGRWYKRWQSNDCCVLLISCHQNPNERKDLHGPFGFLGFLYFFANSSRVGFSLDGVATVVKVTLPKLMEVSGIVSATFGRFLVCFWWGCSLQNT